MKQERLSQEGAAREMGLSTQQVWRVLKRHRDSGRGLVGIRRVVALLYHPQGNDKLERYHRTVSGQMRLIALAASNALREAMASFVHFYNHRRYHEALASVMPADACYRRREAILPRRKNVRRMKSCHPTGLHHECQWVIA